MLKKEKVLSGIILFLSVIVLFLGYKSYDYRTNLIEKKKIIAEKDKIIKQKDENFLKGMKLSYEALTRSFFVDTMRTYGVRHPFSFEEVEFQTAIRKSGESSQKFLDYLNENGFKDGKLTNIIDKETGDFKSIMDKMDSFSELMSKEDSKKENKNDTNK